MKYISILLVTGLLLSCVGGRKSSTQSSSDSASTPELTFNADSAYAYIEKQVDFGPRTPESDGHKICGDWLVTKLSSYGLTVQEQTFPGVNYSGSAVTGRNIIASLNPEQKERILLMAHWDTRAVADEDPDPSHRSKPILGADDGGSGVGVLIELARQFSLAKPNIGIDIVLFDLEDGGHSGNDESWCLGSQYWAKNPHVASYTARCGILLDMVGAKGARFHWEEFSKAYAAPIMMDVWDVAKKLGHGEYFQQSDGGGITDDHIPVIKHLKIPCIDIVNFAVDRSPNGFGHHWHTQKDDMSVIDKRTLQAVGESVEYYIRNYMK